MGDVDGRVQAGRRQQSGLRRRRVAGKPVSGQQHVGTGAQRGEFRVGPGRRHGEPVLVKGAVDEVRLAAQRGIDALFVIRVLQGVVAGEIVADELHRRRQPVIVGGFLVSRDDVSTGGLAQQRTGEFAGEVRGKQVGLVGGERHVACAAKRCIGLCLPECSLLNGAEGSLPGLAEPRYPVTVLEVEGAYVHAEKAVDPSRESNADVVMDVVRGAIHALGSGRCRRAALATAHGDAGRVQRGVEQAVAKRDGQRIADGCREVVLEHDEHHRLAFEARMLDELRGDVGHEFTIEPAIEIALGRLCASGQQCEAQHDHGGTHHDASSRNSPSPRMTSAPPEWPRTMSSSCSCSFLGSVTPQPTSAVFTPERPSASITGVGTVPASIS